MYSFYKNHLAYPKGECPNADPLLMLRSIRVLSNTLYSENTGGYCTVQYSPKMHKWATICRRTA